MAEPIPPAETVEDAMRHASEQLRALKKTKPQNAAEARLHSAELVRLQQELISATHRATDAAAAKRISNGNGLGTRDGREHHWLSTRDFPMLAKAIVPFVKELITEAVAECLRDGGTWQKEVMYQPNQVVTCGGTMWVCKQPNANSKPPGDCWRQLHRTIFKGGR